MIASTPYGRSAGSCRKVTPFSLGSSGSAAVVDPQAEAAPDPLLQLPPDEVGGLRVQRWPRGYQGDLQFGLARMVHGDPPEVRAHHDVGVR